MIGININCKEKDWVDLIIKGTKTIETRDSHSLRPWIGQKVGIIKTGCGRAKLYGYCFIIDEIEYKNLNDFRMDTCKHCVYPGDPYDFMEKKYGYVLDHITIVDNPIEIFTKGIVVRKVE